MKVTATLERRQRDDDPGCEWVVQAVWDAPVDRPSTHGWVLLNRRTAERLVAAVNAQAVYTDPVVKTDVKGHTYVQAHSRVLGRHASADLTRLGF